MASNMGSSSPRRIRISTAAGCTSDGCSSPMASASIRNSCRSPDT